MYLARIHLLLALQSVLIVLGSINRLSSLTLGYVDATEFLRWVDWINLLVIPFASVLVSYLLLRHLQTGERTGGASWVLALNVLFVAGVYLLGASYGNHEVTNYLHARFCTPDDASALCRIVIFNDDAFSHHIFFIAFTLINAVLLLAQVAFPWRGGLTRPDTALLVVNAVFVALGIFANLAFESIGLDLVVIVALALLSAALWWRTGKPGGAGRQPLVLYYTAAYWLGLAATVVYRLLAR